MSGAVLTALAGICVITYLSYGQRATRQLRARNGERLRRRLHKTVTVELSEGKIASTLTGRIDAVGAREATICDRSGRRWSIPLTAVRNVHAASRH